MLSFEKAFIDAIENAQTDITKLQILLGPKSGTYSDPVGKTLASRYDRGGWSS